MTYNRSGVDSRIVIPIGTYQMAYRVIFWRPKSGINVWLPASQPLGETIRTNIMRGEISDSLDNYPAQELFERLKSTFTNSRIDDSGYLHWSDEIDNGFVVRCGEQYVEVCSFELSTEEMEKIFSIAEEFPGEYYDWGN